MVKPPSTQQIQQDEMDNISSSTAKKYNDIQNLIWVSKMDVRSSHQP